MEIYNENSPLRLPSAAEPEPACSGPTFDVQTENCLHNSRRKPPTATADVVTSWCQCVVRAFCFSFRALLRFCMQFSRGQRRKHTRAERTHPPAARLPPLLAQVLSFSQ